MNITLPSEPHPEYGDNPHVTYCKMCDEDMNIVQLGINNFELTCSKCETTFYDKSKNAQCPNCNSWVYENTARKLKPTDRIQSDHLCDRCVRVIEVAKKGGVIVKCRKCNSIFAISGRYEAVRLLREQFDKSQGYMILLIGGPCHICEDQEGD